MIYFFRDLDVFDASTTGVNLNFAVNEPNYGAGFGCQKAVLTLDSDSIVEISPVSCAEKLNYICILTPNWLIGTLILALFYFQIPIN